MHRAVASVMPPGFTERHKFYHQPSGRHYTLIERDGKFFQRRHQTGPSGIEINTFEREIHFVVGSGNHAKSFLHRSSDGRLYELPLAWYAAQGGHWAMNPGFDHPNHPDFRREIPHECVFCHTAYPALPPGADNVGSEPLFPPKLPEGIDCQRCHGPGGDHIQAPNKTNIVNPSRLTGDRQLEVCMQCHLETTSSRLPHTILRWNRGAFSYLPGEPLGDYAIHFDHAPGTGRDNKFEIASHAYRFRKSLCFLASGGRLTCTTCHSPHDPTDRQAAIRACRSCHTPHTQDPDCVSCHMPLRRTEDVVHVTMTDHFIQRRKPPGDLLSLRTERLDTVESAYRGPVALYYPEKLPATPESELYLAVAQVKQFSNLRDGIPRLAKLVDQVRPANPHIYLELAEAYNEAGSFVEAARHYENSFKLAPNLRPARLGLARALSKIGDQDRAVFLLREVAEKDPAASNGLGLLELQRGHLHNAIAAFRRAVELQPEYPEAYNNLAGALAQTGDRPGAVQAYREAIRLQPDLSQARFAYGLLLAGEERYQEAAVEFEAATRANPALAEAHSGLGDMLAIQGKFAEAIRHYRRALALRPDLESARSGLKMATGR